MPGTGLRSRIVEGRRLVGTFSLIPSIEVIEIIAIAGFDFVIVDMEHGPYDLGSVRAACVASHAADLPVVVRVRGSDPEFIGTVLDTGCDGVLVPQVSSVAQARKVLRAARFTPDGDRGANPYVRAAAYGATQEWFATANRDVTVMLMIEGHEGIAAYPEILGLPGLDVAFFGPVDLSHSMGVPGQPGHPRVIEALARLADHATDRGVATAVFAQDGQAARDWARRGVQVVARGVDTDLIRSQFERAVAESRLADVAVSPASGTASR